MADTKAAMPVEGCHAMKVGRDKTVISDEAL